MPWPREKPKPAIDLRGEFTKALVGGVAMILLAVITGSVTYLAREVPATMERLRNAQVLLEIRVKAIEDNQRQITQVLRLLEGRLRLEEQKP